MVKRYWLAIGDVNYARIEAGDGPLVLLMHGTFGGKQLMLPQLEHLSRSFRCIAFDWPGYGESGFKPGGWTVEDLVSAVPEVIEACGERSAFLCGVSQGGAVSMRVALAYPEKVRGLVNMCAGPGGPPLEGAWALDQFAAVLAREPDENVRRSAAVEFVAKIFHDPGFAMRAPDRAKAEVDLILNHPRESVGLLPGVPKSYKTLSNDDLALIRCLTLILWARFESRSGLGAELAATIPDSELVIVGEAGHHVNVDQPEATSLAIEQFLLKNG